MIQLKYYPPAGRGGGGGEVTKKRFVWESSGLTPYSFIYYFWSLQILHPTPALQFSGSATNCTRILGIKIE